jgi:ABC-type oligopeptide transport system substrate-binding subunit
MKAKHLTVFFITALLAMGASCQRRETTVQRGTRDQVLLRGAGMEPSTLDPQRNYGHPENMMIRELFDSLVVSDPRDNEVKPNGAERWEISADGLTG